jgi:MFS family permease
MLVAPLVAVYIVSLLLRNSLGVIAPDLAAELDLSAAGLGLLASAYFITFAAIQIPLGMALDRYGSRLCLVIGAAITAVGAAVFGLAAGTLGLFVGRALMGFGTAASLMAPLATYSRRFPPQRFGMLAGLQMSLGMIGTLLATAPLALSAATIGWRASFLIIAAITCCIGTAIFFSLADESSGQPSTGETLAESLAGIGAVLRTPSVGRVFVMNLVAFSSISLIVALWGGPYLAHVYGMDLKERGTLLLLPVVGQMLCSAGWGAINRLTGSYKSGVMAGALLTAGSLGLLALTGAPPFWVLAGWLIFFGSVSAYTPALLAHGKVLFAPHQIGRGLTILNVGTMVGTFVSQAVTGAIIGAFPPLPDGSYELNAYRLAFAVQAALILLALLVYFPAREPR